MHICCACRGKERDASSLFLHIILKVPQGEEEEEGADKGGKVEVEESTGLGKWESVVIESADERGKDEDNGTRKELHSEKNKNSKREYKGVSLQTSRTVQNDSLSAGDCKMTKFKKRRKKE